MQLAAGIHLVGSEQMGLSHPLDCNMYLIDGGDEIALIDTGTGFGTADVLEQVVRAGYHPEQITHILITHLHAGHTGGAKALREACRAAVLVPRDTRSFVVAGTDPGIAVNMRTGLYPPDYIFPCFEPDAEIVDGQILRIGNRCLHAIQVRGHTQDSLCFLLEGEQRALFTGDTLFYGGAVGIVNLPGCSLESYRQELPKLAGLKVAMLCPAHGMFVLRGGQRHIDAAVEAFSRFELPRTLYERNPFAI